MSSDESQSCAKPATPPQKQCTFQLVCGFLSCRLVETLSRSTLDGPRKRYIKERKVYQQYMDDQEKQERDEQKKFTGRLCEQAKDLVNIRKRLRRRRYATKPGSPPPRQPPCCPHWDKERPEGCRAQKKGSTESLSVYEPGQMSRRERYEERLRDPTSKEAKRKAACEEARRSPTTPSTSSGRSDEVDVEMERLRQRVLGIDERNAVLVGALGMKPARKTKDQPEAHQTERQRVVHPFIENESSGGRSLGTIALNGSN